MLKIRSFLCFLALLTLFVSCSSTGVKEREKLRSYFLKGEYQKAHELIKTTKSYKEKKSRLLFYLEEGLIHHAQGNYYQSILSFEKAKDISQKLFTKSVTKKAKTWIVNDTSDNYYGASFERSLIHFYLALNHALLYQRGFYEEYQVKDKNGKDLKKIPAKKLSKNELSREIMAARAEILAWDSFLSDLKNEKMGNSVFKNDLMAKTFGAYIHEMIGTYNDNQIALQLYKDAKILLFRNYNGYRTFNNKFKKFKGDFKKLPQMSLNKVKKEYVSPTSYQKSLLNFLNYRILELTKYIRPSEYKKMVKLHRPSKRVLESLNKRRKRSNVSIIFQRGLIPPKVPDKFYFSLESAFGNKKNSSIARFGSAAISHFAAYQLGLLPPTNEWNPAGAAVGVGVASLAVGTAAISFELPIVKNVPVKEKVELHIFDMAGKPVLKENMALINPLGDIAQEAVAEDSAWRYTRLGARLAVKHIAAIATAYATYAALKKKVGKYFAKSAAVLEYTAANRIIQASEKADTRYWSLLPADLRISMAHLPKGKYTVKAIVYVGSPNNMSNKKVYNLGEIVVKDTKKRQIITFRSKN